MKILVAGDFVPIGRFEKCLSDGSYNYDSIKEYTHSTDLSILNLESPIVNKNVTGIRKSGPHLKVPSKCIAAIKNMGFSAVALANNHFRDYGQDGVETTIAELKNEGIEYVGGGVDYEEAHKILYRQNGKEKIAVVNFCENEFSIATNNHGGAMPLDVAANYDQIKEAKQNANYVVVIVHGGHEGYQLPSPRMKKLYRLFVDFGADAVVNHHQHCFSGYEVYKGKPIIYGLGNFIFDWPGRRNNIWNRGYMVQICFENSKIDFELIPYEQSNEKAGAFILNKDEKNTFEKEIKLLNNIISNDTKLKEAYVSFVNSKRNGVISRLGPFSNKYLMGLVSRGLVPSFLTKKKSAMLYNYICCEAHRDITLEILREIIED